jgi:hypothetical protein
MEAGGLGRCGIAGSSSRELHGVAMTDRSLYFLQMRIIIIYRAPECN